jgi:hypothetical protein
VARANHEAGLGCIEETYRALQTTLTDDPAVRFARDHMATAERAYSNKCAQLNRMPAAYLPRWLFVLLLICLGIAEVLLNAMVFSIFGEIQVNTWIFSIALAIALPILGHIVGLNLREHGEGIAWLKLASALVVFGLVVAGLYYLALLRQAYLGIVLTDLGLPQRLLDASFQFFWINLLVFVAATAVSYLTHDPVHGFEKLGEDYRKTAAEYHKAELDCRWRLRGTQEEKAAKIREANERKAEALARVTTL